MKKIIFCGLIFLCSCCTIFAQDINIEKLIYAISMVESKGNPKAVNKSGSCVGLLQMKTIAVDDCNLYLKSKGSKKRYSYEDRYDANKSIEMFHLIQERYKNYKSYRSKTQIEHMIRLWNGGCGYTISGTQNYYNKVISIYIKDI